MATAFLLLYLFIAMPVQLWHHHFNDGANTGKLKISKNVSDNNIQTETCKICQHTYAPYVADYSIINLSISFTSVAKTLVQPDRFFSAFISKLSNKGPPSI